MAKSKQTPPKLAVSIPMSKVNTTASRLDALVPNLASELSPSLLYLPGANNEVVKNASALGSSDYGWTAPDLNEGQPYTVQVECFGAGGGGGGGAVTGTGGGGGGGGGEYACEPLYPVIPGETYSYFAGKGGLAGKTSGLLAGATAVPGASGQPTAFDLRGKGITGGVVANGGQGGDQSSPGTPGNGGTGSSNSIHSDGGNGGGLSGGNTFTDNPWVQMADVNDLFLWYRLDDSIRKGIDYSLNWNDATSVYTTTNGFVANTSSGGIPAQTPVIGVGPNGGNPDNAGKEAAGFSWKFDRGTQDHGGGYLAAPVFTFGGPGWVTLGFSIWVKGLPNARSSTDWGVTYQGQTAVIVGNADSDSMYRGGWFLGINSAGVPVFEVNTDNGTYTLNAASALSATDGNWHMLSCTFVANAASGMNLYVDGALSSTKSTNTGSNYFTAGPAPVALGMAKASAGYYYNGYLSNFYLMHLETYNSTKVGNSFGTTGATAAGGGGGGASGGSAGAGNNGANATSSSGAAAGASAAASNPGINTGSGAGGAGGNSGASGSSAPASAPYSGGGGGAGARATAPPSQFSIEVPCSMSASYAGLDASGAADGQLYTVSADPNANENDPWYNTAAKQDAICYSGGSGDAPFKGSMNTLVTFPALSAVDGNAGNVTDYLSSTDWSLLKVFLKLTVETTSASVLAVSTWDSNAILGALDSDTTLAAWGYGGVDVLAYIPAGAAGRQVYVDLSGTTILSTMVSSAYGNTYAQSGHALMGTGLLIGTLQGSALNQVNIHGAWNADEAQDWYTAFHGADASNPELSAALEISYQASGNTLVTAGNGADGYIIVRFINPKGTPVASVVAQQTTDANGNVHAAGINSTSAAYNVWNPISSPQVPEVFNAVGTMTTSFASGYTQHGTGMTSGWQLLPGNMLYICLDVDCTTTNAAVFTLPLGWRPAGTHFGSVTTSNTTTIPSGGAIITPLFYQIGSNGVVNIQNSIGSPLHRYFVETIINLNL